MPLEFNINYAARLARISLTPAEEEQFGSQVAGILEYIEKLKNLDVTGIEPTAHAMPLVNITRADVVQPSLSNEEALQNAPAKANGLFMVPKILE